ncbi:MAG: T9SS type A sorting domain-containing protein [Bacteroidetes bacterium]|nr:T9SS type A sorting domain-containing protein [Bacteroidota bacterium]
MNKKLTLPLILLIGFLSTLSYSQTPIPTNYPLVKGHYKSVQKDSTTLFCLTDYGLMIWDVSNLNVPILLSKLPAPGFYLQGKIKEYSDYLFIQRSDTIIVVDKSNLTNPTYVNLNLSLNYINDIDIKDTILYVATNNNKSISVYVISDITNPTLITTINSQNIDHVSVVDTFLFAYNSYSFFRYDVTTSTPILLDSIVFGPNRSIISAQANNNSAIITLGDAMNFNQIIGNFAYDISTIGNPVLIDSTAISINSLMSLLRITDSLLYAHNNLIYNTYYNLIYIYDITNLNSIICVDTIGVSCSPYELLIDDSLLFTMTGRCGFDIYQKMSSFNYSLVDTHNVGGWIYDIQSSSTAFIFASASDSVYVFDKKRSTSEVFGDYSFITKSNDMRIIDSFMLETRVDGLNSIRFSSINSLPAIDSLSIFYDSGNAYIHKINIWDKKLYNDVTGYGTEIFDISTPSNPILLSNNIPETYKGWYNDILYDYDYNTLSYIDLYDATVTPPKFIKQVFDSIPVFCGPSIWDPQRPMKHFICTSMGNSFFQLDLSDTSNIHYTSTRPMLGMNGYKTSLAKVRDSILYLPGAGGVDLHIFDICDIYHYRKISVFKTKRPIQSIVIIDTILFISFGGYIESFDVSNIEPCLVYNSQKQFNRENNLTIFPNPSRGSFTITFSSFDNKMSLIITNMLGQKVLQKELQGARNDIMTVNLNLNIEAGLYFVNVIGGNQSIVKKVVME